MFEDVNSVDWKNLSHSHGTAEEVPARLAAVVGPSDKDRGAALEYFWEYLLHQGTRYEASPFVVAFLFEACITQRLGLARGSRISSASPDSSVGQRNDRNSPSQGQGIAPWPQCAVHSTILAIAKCWAECHSEAA